MSKIVQVYAQMSDDLKTIEGLFADNGVAQYEKDTLAVPFIATNTDGSASLVGQDGQYPLPIKTINFCGNYMDVLLPLNQAAGNPTDYSGNNAEVTIEASNTEAYAWGNAGFFTSKATAAAAAAVIPSANVAVDFSTESFIRAFTLATPIAANAICGSADGTSPGYLVNMDGSGKIGPRIYVAAGLNFSGKYGNSVVGGCAIGATTDSAGYAAGATTINLASAGVGAINVNDKIIFEGDKNLYTVATGDADVSGGGSIVISPGLLVALPAAAKSINIVSGTKINRILHAWDAPTKTIYQYVNGVLDIAITATQVFAASEIETHPVRLGRGATGSTIAAKFAGFVQMRFPGAGLPKSLGEIAVKDNMYRTVGLTDFPLFI